MHWVAFSMLPTLLAIVVDSQSPGSSALMTKPRPTENKETLAAKLQDTFLGLPFGLMLDSYQIPIEDVILDGIQFPECSVVLFPSDATRWRMVSLHVRFAPGTVAVSDEDWQALWNRKTLGRAVVTEITRAIEYPQGEVWKGGGKEWEQELIRLRKRTHRWMEEVMESRGNETALK